MYDNQTKLLEENKPQLSSFRMIPEAGHCVSTASNVNDDIRY